MTSRRYTMAMSGFVLLVQAFAVANSSTAETAQERILDILRARDAAYSRNDANGALASVADVYNFTDEKGSTRSVKKAEALSALNRDLRDVPGNRIVRRQLTSVHSLSVIGSKATMKATTIQELVGSNQVGTVVQLRFTYEFEDTWQLTQGEWSEVAIRLLVPVDKATIVSPSPMVLGMLNQMRQSADQMRQFNDNNNFSTCMTANQNQRYEYETRKAYCSP